MAFFLGGALGVAHLARRLFRTVPAQTSFVLLTCCSYPVTAGFVNTVCPPTMVAAAAPGEACACDLVEPVGRSQPTVSHHLSLLVDAGLLTREKRGRWAWYRVVPERLEMLRSVLAPAAALSS